MIASVIDLDNVSFLGSGQDPFVLERMTRLKTWALCTIFFLACHVTSVCTLLQLKISGLF